MGVTDASKVIAPEGLPSERGEHFIRNILPCATGVFLASITSKWCGRGSDDLAGECIGIAYEQVCNKLRTSVIAEQGMMELANLSDWSCRACSKQVTK